MKLRSTIPLIATLTRREIMGRYKGSTLGILWSLLIPLFMLAVYTFVFGSVFNARWPNTGETTTMGEFAVILFCGLIVFQLFSEVINQAPNLVLSNVNYVKKVVFPLEILALSSLGSALFHAGVSLVVLLAFLLYAYGAIPLTALALPLVLLPYCLIILGLAWILSSVGVFLRDIGQLLGPAVTALMFLSGIFFPLSALPEGVRFWMTLNPVALSVEQTRDVLIFGTMPELVDLAVYTAIATIIASLGYWWFQKTRQGFADVL